MVTATYTFPNGTIVNIDGTVEEVQALHAFYDSAPQSRSVTKSKVQKSQQPSDDNTIDIIAIVNEIKSCEESDLIELQILNKSNLAAKVILPLYINQKYFENTNNLNSGHVVKITAQLGIKLDQGNVSRCLSGSAKAFVMADSVRKKGQPTGYKLSRKGNTHIEKILSK